MTTGPDPDRLELRVERVVAGGDGLARDGDGKVVFVAGALSGERVVAEPVESKRDFTRARLVEVLEPDAGRVEPPCPYVAAGCGGCDLQHAAPDLQRELKVGIVADALRRLGGMADPPVVDGPTLPTTGFRTTVRAGVGDGRLGLRRRSSHEVVPVDHCLVAHPAADAVLARARAGEAREVTIRVGGGTGEALVVAEPTARGLEVPEGVAVIGDDELDRGRRAAYHDEVAGVRLQISANAFFQSRSDGAATLVEVVLAAGGEELARARTVADCYGGVGLFAAHVGRLASHPRVVLVERSRPACADAAVNLAHVDATIQRRPVERWRPVPVDVAIADPARQGLGAAAVEVLAGTGAVVIVLVSCDAAALGRDARLLAEAGYRLERSTVVDLFPHTHHVEVVSRFVRST